MSWIDNATVETKAEKDAHELINARVVFKAERASQVAKLTVKTGAGNIFDANEQSQERMNRIITVLRDEPAGATTIFILANNTPYQVDYTELVEALKLAGLAQTALWVQHA
tara:strand:+ start:689 stop:1021 length:333 start_codon:yes stop_codon:yes gene_type:complete